MSTTEVGNSSTNISARDINSMGYTTENYDYGFLFDDKEHTLSLVEVVSFPLSILGALINILSICAVSKVHKKLSTHLNLIISLCLSDCLILATSVLKSILLIAQRVNICFNVAARLLTDLALIATLLNLLAIAVDHYLAILKPFFYKKEMTNIRGICVVMAIWILSVITISVEIVMGKINQQEMEPVCQAIAFDKANSEFGIVTFIFVVLFVIIMIYIRIYICIVRNRSAHSNRRHRQKDSGNFKALVTTSLFVLTFVLFWVPIGIFNAYIYTKGEEYSIENFENIVLIAEILRLILLLNAIADPVIYTIRLPQVHRRCFTCNTNIRRQSTRMITLTSEA